jgi:hypothetical protein
MSGVVLLVLDGNRRVPELAVPNCESPGFALGLRPRFKTSTGDSRYYIGCRYIGYRSISVAFLCHRAFPTQNHLDITDGYYFYIQLFISVASHLDITDGFISVDAYPHLIMSPGC